MATKFAYKRLTKEYMNIMKSPPPFIIAKPLESNILEWHYVITGPPDSPYHNGEYHGVLNFPSEYPLKPPSIKMITPNGRFKTNFKLCLSMSDYHPKTWNPAWSVSTILTGLLSFMLEDTPTTGSIVTSKKDKIEYAAKSKEFNRNDLKFKNIFPELCNEGKSTPSADNIHNSSNNLRERRHYNTNIKQQSAQTKNEINNDNIPLTTNTILYLIIALIILLLLIIGFMLFY
ncbi:UBC-like protein [Anaeromyces robustus]|uniref:Ubiquitin-conjugating enzyme E2 6 n=1 Tax=Anaeromyces robustus TaxID=1754192 RepID=A0A1Y1WGC2_9FUNG|nr:UBC-like protein [Anaeromyces robustus]|eukprot:ORX72591.1 UBC-like protein [Anaeromyces robustus]